MAQQQIYMIALNWQSFNVSLSAIDAKMKADHPSYAGNQAHKHLELYFTADPKDIEADIKAWWNAMTADSAEAKAYQSKAQVQAAAGAAKASALGKLKALGLSDAEVAVLIGG